MMQCPECGTQVSVRITNQKGLDRERTYVCRCGTSFDTVETIFRVKTKEQRKFYQDGTDRRSLAQKARKMQLFATKAEHRRLTKQA